MSFTPIIVLLSNCKLIESYKRKTAYLLHGRIWLLKGTDYLFYGFRITDFVL
jgi:hypothetical protein